MFTQAADATVLPADRLPCDPSDHRPAAPGSTEPRWSSQPWSWLGLTMLLVAARLPTFQVWGDVRYTLGVERVTARTGWPSWEVWTHRPMLNRVLMAALDRLTIDPFREAQLLAWSALAAAGAVWLLHRQLRRWLGWVESAALCAAMLASLVWASSITILQAEWYANVTAIAAVGLAGLAPSRHRLVGLAAGLGSALLLVATALMKWTTVSTAVMAAAVVVTLCWHRRPQLVLIAVASVVLLPLILGLQVLLVPHEGLWLKELPLLNPDSAALELCRPWPAPRSECGLQILMMNEGITSPALLLLPAALVVLAGTARGGLRAAALVLPAVAVAATVTLTVVQAQWFPYHLATMPVMAAGWLGWASARSTRCTPPAVPALGAAAILAGVVSVWLLTRPLAVRKSSAPLWFGESPATWAYAIAILLTAVGMVLAALDLRRHVRGTGAGRAGAVVDRRAPVVICALAVLGTLLNPVLPGTAYSFNFRADTKTSLVEQQKASSYAAGGAKVRDVIGADTPVVYLAPGERSYWVGNPTYCRYAAATYLNRSVWVDTSHLVGFAENLSCLADRRAAYAVIEPGWFKLERTDPGVRRELDEYFDCSHPALVRSFHLVCPRRPGR